MRKEIAPAALLCGLAALLCLPAGGVVVEQGAEELCLKGRTQGVCLKDDRAVALLSERDDFSLRPMSEMYKVSLNTSYGEDEYGVVDYNTDAAMVTQQTRPDKSIFVEAHDNDSVHISRPALGGATKGFVMLDIWPTRLWPTSGTVTITLSESGERFIRFPLSASDYTHGTVKQVDGETLSAKGGPPYFSSYMKHNIYVPSEAIPASEQRWWTMRLLYRPAYAAGSLDGSVCREIEDPERRPIKVRKLEIGVQQLETYIRNLRYKALLGEVTGPPVSLKAARWGEVGWRGRAPEKTRIGLQIRAADDEAGIEKAEWRGPSEDQPYFLKRGRVPADLVTKNLLQVKVLLKAQIDAPFEASPEVEAVVISQED